MHPVIRHLGKTLLGAGLAVGVSTLSGCEKPPPPKVQRPAYPDLGLKTNLPPIFKDTIMERTDLGNTGPLAVTSYGLTVNLRYSGDSRAPQPVREWMIKEMYRHGMGNLRIPGYKEMTPERVLADKRAAIIMVGSYLPPGARKGDRVDVICQALPGSDTASLSGGMLFQSELRLMGANPLNPGGAVNKFVEARGPIFINPAYALETPKLSQGAARAGAQMGTILGGGIVTADRPIHLKMRTPQWNISRAVEAVIDQRFQNKDVAAAQDEGYLHLYVPEKYPGGWTHFVAVVNHLYINQTPASAAVKAQELVEAAQKPNAPLEDISWALEGIGTPAVPQLQKLLSNPAPDIRFAAARAGCYLGDTNSEDTLIRIAQTPNDPFRLNAIMALGEVQNNPEINRAMAKCLDADESMIRIAAYQILAAHNDSHVSSTPINDTFVLDVVESSGKPLIYATRVGEPRLVIFGGRMSIKSPLLFNAFDSELTIATHPTKPNLLSIFYRGEELSEPIQTLSRPMVVELVARLAGAGQEKLRFGYGECVAVLQKLVDSRNVEAAFVLQDVPGVGENLVETPDNASPGRPVGEPAESKPKAVAPAVGANTQAPAGSGRAN